MPLSETSPGLKEDLQRQGRMEALEWEQLITATLSQNRNTAAGLQEEEGRAQPEDRAPQRVA